MWERWNRSRSAGSAFSGIGPGFVHVAVLAGPHGFQNIPAGSWPSPWVSVSPSTARNRGAALHSLAQNLGRGGRPCDPDHVVTWATECGGDVYRERSLTVCAFALR